MPTFFNPARVDITEGGGSGVLSVLAVAAPVAVVVAAALFVLAHLVFIAVGLVAVVVVTGGSVLALKRFARPDWAPLRARPAVTATASARAIPADAPAAIETHQHIHLHGLTPDDVAAIIAAHRDGTRAVGDKP